MRVIGVSFDTPEENAQFARKYDFPFSLVSDHNRLIGIHYGAATSIKDEYAKRIAYVIDEEGKIREAHAKVDAKSYPREQLKTL